MHLVTLSALTMDMVQPPQVQPSSLTEKVDFVQKGLAQWGKGCAQWQTQDGGRIARFQQCLARDLAALLARAQACKHKAGMRHNQ